MQPTGLRQLDWRFLLPDPLEGVFQHLVLLGGGAGLAKRIVEQRLARRVSCTIPRDRSADAVVALHKAQVILSDVAECLLPGGAVYFEVNRRLSRSVASTPGRFSHALQNAGLSPTGSYLVSPDFGRRQVYIPLDARKAVRWYLETFFTATTPALRLLEPALRALATFGNGLLPRLVPHYAITAIAGPTRDTSSSILGHPGLPRDFQYSNLRPLLLTPGEDDLNRVVMLPFPSDSDRPIGVFKFSRTPDRNILTEEEQISLTAIRTKLSEAMRRTIPEPLGTVQWGGLSVSIESCARGRLLATSTSRWGRSLHQKLDDLHRAVTWITEFHCQAQVKRSPWGDSELREWVDIQLEAYQRAFGVIASEEQLFATVRRRARSLVGIVLPTVLVHWNFSVSHLFRADSEITVVDWEGVVPGPSLIDLLYFVIHWSYSVRYLRGADAQLFGFRDLFFGDRRADSVSTAAHEAITQYMTRLGIDQRFFPLLLVIMCVLRALGRFDRKKGAGERGERARTGNQYVRYLGLLAENVEQLFGDNGK
jgi:Phosphotransferase enzyme family